MFNVDLAILALELSFAYFADNSFPLITLRILFEAPYFRKPLIQLNAELKGGKEGIVEEEIRESSKS